MSGNFLTPTAIWKDFKLDGEICAEIIGKSSVKGISVSHLRITGRKTADGAVGIYAVLTHKAQLTFAPAIIILNDFKNCGDTALSMALAEKGYIALTVDLAGATEENIGKVIEGVDKPYTLYPESLNYANYDIDAENKAEIVGDARNTCWYEWGRVIRYCVEYLKTQSLITKIGVLGMGDAATPLWQVLSADCGISCAVIAANCGWKGYRGIDKFGDTPEPQFTDDALKYLAGIEPQAYAAHVKCPLMLVAPTNSPCYDIDRSYDTISRIPAKIYAAADYSVGERYEVNAECFNDALVFFDAFLVKENAVMPEVPSVKGTFNGGVLQVEVSPDEKGLKSLAVYFAEEEIRSDLRAWEKSIDAKASEKGTFVFEHMPYNGTESVFFFARAEYDNGMRICSGVMCKKSDQIKGDGVKSRVLYSSRLSQGAGGFYPAEDSCFTCFNTDKNAAVKVKNGPMDIAGLFSPKGVVTFKVNTEKYKPIQGAMLMFDVFVKGDGNLTVKAITDYFGAKNVYYSQIKLFGDLWQNVKIEINYFKTVEGMGLKSYDSVEALEFSADEEFLINNILWV